MYPFYVGRTDLENLKRAIELALTTPSFVADSAMKFGARYCWKELTRALPMQRRRGGREGGNTGLSLGASLPLHFGLKCGEVNA